MKVLAVFAHPDDEVLGAGGTLAKFIGQGHHVTVAIAASNGVWHAGTTSLQERNVSLPHRACAALGITDVRTWGFADQTLDQIPERDLGELFINEVRDTQPALVISHHIADLNVDHQRISRSAMVATRPGVINAMPDLWAAWVPSASDAAFGFLGDFKPNIFVDIALTQHRKHSAMGVYSSEMRDFPHPRSYEALHHHEAFWGTMAGITAAEPFQILRSSR